MLERHSPSRGPDSPDVWGLHDETTGSVAYVFACPATRRAAIVDAVLDFDPVAARLSTGSLDALLAIVARERLAVEIVLDTHPHADHVMAAATLAGRLGAPVGIGERVRDIAALWERLYNLPGVFDPARDFDRLFADGDRFTVGEVAVDVILSPGHTLGSVTYVAGDAAFVHDTFMQPDSGTARCDFPGGSSADLWQSLQRLLALPDATRLLVGHDYRPGGRPAAWEASVAEQRAHNIHLRGATEASFRALRDERDRTLPLPERMLAALQMNLRAGRVPPPEADGHSYLKIPLDRFPAAPDRPED
jgi:glyoxylase-like metal-dependent hydrolase (beta-lactamase superfamily II)